MASESGSPEFRSFIESLINSRNREIPLFLPFILLNPTNPLQPSTNPSSDPQDQYTRRFVIINPLTQGDGSLIDELFSAKIGQPPASNASIDALPSVEVVVNVENCNDQCVVCLEEWKEGETAKQMPCKHLFHGGCIEKWLKIHGSCPVCRYQMPVDEEQKKNTSDNDGGRRTGILVGFFSSRGESADSN